MDSLRYPDSGELLEDASILRNAVHFTTAQRAFAAYGLLSHPLDRLQKDSLAFLAISAFTGWMTSMEDVLGWLLVLKEWKPGDVSKCLLRLLDKVQVARDTEEKANVLLASLDPGGLRALLHIPDDADLKRNGFPRQIREGLNEAIPANLGGLRRLIELRQQNDRAYVVAFNKLKHLLLAVRTNVRGRDEVLIPKWRGLDQEENVIHLQNAWIACTPANIRVMASRAIVAQAVLNSLLGTILWIRFGEPYSTPAWAVKAFELPGWYDEGSAQK
jgi:hypothetical protein